MDYAQMSEQYIENLRRVRELSRENPAFSGNDEALLAHIRKNSAYSFTLMQENNRLLDLLVFSRKAEDLTDEDIEQLSDFAGKLFHFSQSEDVGIAHRVYRLLLEAARVRGDEDLLIKECYNCGVSLHYSLPTARPLTVRRFAPTLRRA